MSELRVHTMFLTLFRIGFDIGFFYALIPLFYLVGNLVFNDSAQTVTPHFMFAMVLYHTIKNDQHRFLLIMGACIVSWGLGIYLYTIHHVNDMASISLMPIAVTSLCCILSFMSLFGIKFAQKGLAKLHTQQMVLSDET